MATPPLVSIVTPTRDRAALLESTLRSVRAQTYPTVEHIVRDGASTDSTVDLLRMYEPTYGLRWHSAPDSGMYSAINAGFHEATGEILGYLNSDDLYFPWTVEVVVDAFRRHPEADFVFGDALTVDDDTGRQALYWVPPFNLDYVRRAGFLAQPAVFWRRQVFEEDGGFDETLRFVADCDYWMKAGARRRFVKVPEFLAIERLHRSTLRESVGEDLAAELTAVRSRYVNLVGDAHDRRMKDHERRARLWWRLCSGMLLVQSFVPRRVRRGPWTRLLNTPDVDVSRVQLLARGLPLIRRAGAIDAFASRDVLRVGPRLLEPS